MKRNRRERKKKKKQVTEKRFPKDFFSGQVDIDKQIAGIQKKMSGPKRMHFFGF